MGQLNETIEIRPFQEKDWPEVWAIAQPIFQAGETYPYAPDISEAAAYSQWIELPAATYVAALPAESTALPDRILGSYYLKPNQPELGAHVCNCGYLVAASARGQGIATKMCLHSQAEAKRLGFRAMQFNLVVSANHAALHLWQKLGYERVGVLPGAFNHAQLGFIDAYVLYKIL